MSRKQIRILNTSGIGHNTEIFDEEGNDITQLISIRKIVLDVNTINTAICEMVAQSVDILAQMQLNANGKKVTKVIFDDGEVWDLVGTGEKMDPVPHHGSGELLITISPAADRRIASIAEYQKRKYENVCAKAVEDYAKAYFSDDDHDPGIFELPDVTSPEKAMKIGERVITSGQRAIRDG